MAEKTRIELKQYFETGDRPTEDEFADLIDSIGGATGWASYRDTLYTEVSPFTIADGVTSTVPNNAGTVINAHLPYGVSSLYDGSKITPENVGDYYIFTLRFNAKTTQQVGSYLQFGIDIGGAIGEIFKESVLFAKGANTEQAFSIDTPAFTLDTFVANGGLIKLTSGGGTVSIYDIELQVSRIHKGI